MSEDPKFLAVRRNLQPGYIAFKQDGCRLLYTLDNVTWRLAFDYSMCDTQERIETATKIKELIDAYGDNIPLHLENEGTSAKIGDVALSGMICPIARWIVESYAETARLAIEESHDDVIRFLSLLGGIVATIAGLAAALVTGGASLGISAGGLTWIAAGVGIASGTAQIYSLFENVPMLTDEQKETLICCVSNALKTDFSKASLSSITCEDVPSAHVTAFNAILSKNETWAGIVQAVNEGSVPSGAGCCGDTCAYIMPAAAFIGTNTTRKTPMLIDNDLNAPTTLTGSEKAVYAKYTLAPPRKITGVSVDIYTSGLYSQAGTLLVRLTDISASAGVQGSNTPTIEGVNTYNLPIVGGGVPDISEFAIKVEIARVNKSYVAQWNAATAEIRAIRYCFNE